MGALLFLSAGRLYAEYARSTRYRLVPFVW